MRAFEKKARKAVHLMNPVPVGSSCSANLLHNSASSLCSLCSKDKLASTLRSTMWLTPRGFEQVLPKEGVQVGSNTCGTSFCTSSKAC